jgi:hypothetical protein
MTSRNLGTLFIPLPFLVVLFRTRTVVLKTPVPFPAAQTVTSLIDNTLTGKIVDRLALIWFYNMLYV